MQKLADEATKGYAKQVAELGGKEAITAFENDSQAAQKEIKLHLAKPTDAWRQDNIMHHKGLESMVLV